MLVQRLNHDTMLVSDAVVVFDEDVLVSVVEVVCVLVEVFVVPWLMWLVVSTNMCCYCLH